MGSARTITTNDFIDEIRHELRDVDEAQYTDDELLVYVNRCYELITQILIDDNSELAATGSAGSITLADGTETYDLASNSMGDLWLPFQVGFDDNGERLYAIYLTDASGNVYPPLEMCDYQDRYDYLTSGSTSEGRPTAFYLHGDYIGFLPVPDATYTCTVDRYFPNWEPLSTSFTLQSFNDYSETDVGADRLTVNSSILQTIADLDQDETVYNIKESAVSGDFKRRFGINVSSSSTTNPDSYCFVWALADGGADVVNEQTHYLYCQSLVDNADTHQLACVGDEIFSAEDLYLEYDTNYYIEIERSDTSVYLRAYVDSGYTIQHSSCTSTFTSARSYTHEYAMSAYETAGTGRAWCGTIFSLQTGSAATGTNLPYKNLFNAQIKDGTKLLAKNREGYPASVDTALMEIFQERALAITRKRRRNDTRMRPRFRR